MKFLTISSLYSLCSVLTSVCCKYHLVDGLRKSKVTMSYRQVKEGKEYWRLVTSLFLLDLDAGYDIAILVTQFFWLSILERRLFRGSPSGMLVAIVFIATLLFAPGFYMRELRLKDPSAMFHIVICTWFTVRCFRLNNLGNILRSLSPIVFLVMPHFKNGGVDVALLKHQSMAIAAGLACVMFFPDTEGERELRKKRQQRAKQNQMSNPAMEGAPAGGIPGGRVGRRLQDPPREDKHVEQDSNDDRDDDDDDDDDSEDSDE